ncbi:hypothetical protein GCM10025864_39410 [Luteimicrobium album]|uniref:Glycosyltransferase 2-like domain-containing protein n=1 Tax=Luteimicrobium album TaxID=1054550 RepID=A0ABQ6I6W6_9MICO|nr:glycosyltransferase [Luteimicrobium album]GMA26182.1 hypothetical protein GCM10025864_39410 [Luteimicrobium album]
MPEVVIDGVTYVPVTGSGSRIGVAITAHNRPALLPKALDAWMEHSPDDLVIVVVDDASDEPVSVPDGVTLIRTGTNVGVAAAKNLGIRALMDAGVQHLFLADDDTHPITDDWWKPYVDSPEPHLMLTWGDRVFREGDLVGYTWPKGCMLYLDRRAVERVGGMDLRFGLHGHEHVNLSDRIHNAGLTTVRYGDVDGSEKLFYAGDRDGRLESSVPERVRLAANPELLWSKRDSDEYIDYHATTAPTETDRDIALSVLIPSVHTRRDTFAPAITKAIFDQYEALDVCDQERVEILMLTDTKTMTIGAKRNRMVAMARGEYVAFVDDDDRLESDYLASLLAGIDASGADVVTFKLSVSLDGAAPKVCRYSRTFAAEKDTASEYQRWPNHIMCVKRSIALRTPFQPQRYGEDTRYAEDLLPLLHTEHAIDKVLYHYDWDRTTTEAQLAARYQHLTVQRTKKPLVDIVFLSKAADDDLRAMTQNAIDSAIDGAGEIPVNVIVVEQVEGVRYKSATTIYATEPFSYNAFANRGARCGTAPWVMVANNDLEFTDGWLKPLLDAKHQVVSPPTPATRGSPASRATRSAPPTASTSPAGASCSPARCSTRSAASTRTSRIGAPTTQSSSR